MTFEKVLRLGVFQAENLDKDILRNQNPKSKSLIFPLQKYTEDAVRRGSWMERRWRRLCASNCKGLSLGCYPVCREHGIFQQGNGVIASFFRIVTLRREPRGQESKEQEALVIVTQGMTRA